MTPAHRDARTSLYFVSAPVDCALIGGVSIAAYLALARWNATGVLPVLVVIGARLCNWPHFAATSYRLYHTREHVEQYPMTALGVPVIVLAGMLWAFADPVHVAPAYVKLMLLWSAYHFSGQTLGLSLVYARRAGLSIGRFERLVLAAFIFGTFLAGTAHREAGQGTREYLGVVYPRLGIPPWLAGECDVMVAALAVALALVAIRWCVRGRRLVPPIVLLPAATQCLWFVVGRDHDGFQLLVPFFHSLQYLFIAWAVQLRERLGRAGATASAAYVIRESGRWWSINAVLGVVLFAGLPWAASLLGSDLLLATALTSAAVQLHHFFVDGVIWKLKHATARSPLLVNIAECLRPVSVAAPEAA